jgi:hypothetical protein
MRATASAAGLHYFFRFFPHQFHTFQRSDRRHRRTSVPTKPFLAAGLYDLTDADEKPNRFEEPPGRILHEKRRIKKAQLNEEENECTQLNSIYRRIEIT